MGTWLEILTVISSLLMVFMSSSRKITYIYRWWRKTSISPPYPLLSINRDSPKFSIMLKCDGLNLKSLKATANISESLSQVTWSSALRRVTVERSIQFWKIVSSRPSMTSWGRQAWNICLVIDWLLALQTRKLWKKSNSIYYLGFFLANMQVREFLWNPKFSSHFI